MAKKLYTGTLERSDAAQPLVDDGQLSGSAQMVADEAARNAIPVAKRKIGMIISWTDTGVVLTQKFKGATTADINWTDNANWETLDIPALSQLTDVVLGTPVVDDILRYNGSEWISGSVPVNSGSGAVMFLTDTAIVTGLFTLSMTPDTNPEDTDTVTVNNNTLLIEAYLFDTALGGTQIDAGLWEFDTYLSVNILAGVTDALINVYHVIIGAGTVTTTGAGTSRTATVAGGTPFVLADANAAVATASYLQTPSGIFQITAFTSDSVVTIATLVGYVNEAGVAYNTHRRLFQVVNPEINSTVATLFSTQVTEPAFPIAAVDKLAVYYFARTTVVANRIVSMYHSGTLHYTHFHLPLVTRHNDLAGLQGGAAGELYHNTADENAAISGANSPSAANVFITANDVAAEGASGIAELATQAETDAGTNDTTIITPLKFKTSSLKGMLLSGFNSGTFNPTDSLNYSLFWPATPGSVFGNIGRVLTLRPGTLISARIQLWAITVTGSNEDISLYIRHNNTTDYLIETVGAASQSRIFFNNALSIALAELDYIELKMVCPIWGTNPQGLSISWSIYIA